MSPIDSLDPRAEGAPNDALPPDLGPGGLTTSAPLPPVAAPAVTPADPAQLAASASTSDNHADLSGLAAGAPARRRQRRRGPRLVAPQDKPAPLTAAQRLLLLDTWQRSNLPAGDFAALVGISKHTLYAWKKKIESQGPAGLLDQPRGAPRGSQLPDLTKRTILMR